MSPHGAESDPAQPQGFAGTDRFEGVRVLGSGGMGDVFEAFDRERGMSIAIKALRTSEPDRIRRFKDEFRSLIDLHHPNLISFGELFEKDGSWWFTMERLQGVDFLRHVRPELEDKSSESRSSRASDSAASSHATRKSGDSSLCDAPTVVSGRSTTAPEAAARTDACASNADDDTITPSTPGTSGVAEVNRSGVVTVDPRRVEPRGWRPGFEPRLREALAQLATGLAFLHRTGMVHRDIKSSNIMVEPDGRVVLLDFGLVAELAAGTREERVVGTAAYMAPEQALGEALTPAADWYSVGVLLFRALSGQVPFPGSALEVVAAKVHGPPTDIRDVAPDAPEDLAELCMGLLRREPSERPSEGEILDVLGAQAPDAWQGLSSLAYVAPPPFVGRERELATLRRGLAESCEGAFVGFVLDGPSGIGKSRLVQEFASLVAANDANTRILRGRCHEREAVPFKAFDSVIDQLAAWLGALRTRELRDVLPQQLGPLCTVFPTLLTVKRIDAAVPKRLDARTAETDPTEVRLLAFDALRQLLAKLARKRAVIVIIDDIQWADADSVALIAEVLGKKSAPPLLFIATARGTESSQLPAIRALGAASRTLHVAELDDEAAVTLAEALNRASATRLAPTEVARLVEETGGHPMLIDELMRHSHASSGTSERAGSLDDALRARALSLGADCLELLRVVSACTRPLPQGAVARAAGLTAADYASRANRLRSARLIRISGVRRVDTVEPYHTRVGEAVYATIPAEDRTAMHLRLAEVLEEQSGPPDDIATHFRRGDADPRAVPYLIGAGDAARAGLAFERATSLYLEADAIVQGLPDHPKRERKLLLTKLGDCLQLDGSSESAARAYEQAAKLAAEENSDPTRPNDETLRLLTLAAELFLQNGNIEEGRGASELLLSTFGVTLPSSTLGAILRFVYYDLRLTMHRLEWKKVDEQALDPRQLLLLDAYTALAGGIGMVDPLVANVSMAKAVLLALDAGEPRRLARTLGWQAGSYFALDRTKTGNKLVEACRRACEADVTGKGWFYVTQAQLLQVLLCENDWPRVFALVEKGRAQWLESQEGFANEMELFYQFNCWALEQAGRVATLHGEVERRVEWAERHGNKFVVVTYRSLFVLPALANDEPEKALDDLESAIASWPVDPALLSLQEHMAHRSRTLIALYRGRESEERVELEAGWKRFFGSLLQQTPFVLQDSHVIAGHLELSLACTARDAGDSWGARRRLFRARAHARKLASIRLPLARLGHAELMASLAHVAGEPAEAVRWLRAALEAANSLHCELRAACIAETLAGLVHEEESAWLREDARAIADSIGAKRFDRIVSMQLPAFRYGAPS